MPRVALNVAFWFSVGLVGVGMANCSHGAAESALPPGTRSAAQTVEVAAQAEKRPDPAPARSNKPGKSAADAGKTSAPRPATAAEARQVIDLRSVTKINATRVLDESATYLYYSATSSVPAAAGLYQSELEARGWKRIPNTIPDNPQYRDLLFSKDGYYLRLSVGASGDEGVVGISLSNLGNVNVSSLPRPKNASPVAASTPVNVTYESTEGMPEAVKFCREQLTRLGWHEYGDLYADPPDVPHVKQLNFCRNATRLMVSVIRDPQLPNRGKTMVTYLAHHMLPYDIPVIPGGQGLKLDEIRGRAEYFTSASVEELVGHYREVAPELGWTAQAGADQVRADGASLYVQDEKDLGFGIEIARKDDQTRVSIIRLSFAKNEEASPSQTPTPDVNAVASDDATPTETPSVADEAVNELQEEIEDTVRKQLEAVQEQLKNLDGDVDIPANILQGVLDDATEGDTPDEDASVTDVADDDADESKQKAAAMQAADQELAALEKLATGCTVYYGDDRFELKHALAIRSPDDGSPVLIFCQQPLNVGRAQRALAKGESVSMLDLTGNQFPPAAEIRLHANYIAINCFVDGTSIGRGSTELQSDYLAGTRRVRGTVSMNDAEEVFDKSFRFETTFDQEFLEAAKPGTPGNLDQLTADSNYELPVPEGCGQVAQGRSPYRTTIDAQIDLPLQSVLAFYRRELASRGFRESPAAAPSDEKSSKLTFAGGDGPLTLTLRQVNDATQIELAQRNETKAKQDKLVPAPGQGLLLLANAGDTDVVVTLNKRTIKLPAGKGANDPKDAVKIPVLPGKHRVSVTAGGDANQEELTIEAGTAWGLIALPGGGSLAQVLY